MFVLCRSAQRREKERAMLRKQAERLEEKLLAIQSSVRAGRLRSRVTAERRIGRWLGRYTRAEELFRVELMPAEGPLQDVRVERRQHLETWAATATGQTRWRSSETPRAQGPRDRRRLRVGRSSRLRAAHRQGRGSVPGPDRAWPAPPRPPERARDGAG